MQFNLAAPLDYKVLSKLLVTAACGTTLQETLYNNNLRSCGRATPTPQVRLPLIAAGID